MTKTHEMVGRSFGRWTVVSLGESAKDRCKRWLCRCECGKERVVRGRDLIQGYSKSCGCYNKELLRGKLEDLTGKTFHRWTVISRSDKSKHGAARWLCRCACGVERCVTHFTLIYGQSKSCGCYRVDIAKELCVNISGKRGPDHPRWKGGRFYTDDGYVMLTGESYPGCVMPNQTAEHVVVMARHLGRALTTYETVHHKNGVRDDNRIENLELWTSNHPSGQRVDDLVAWALDLLRMYQPESLIETAIL